jgi:hypothetical protein
MEGVQAGTKPRLHAILPRNRCLPLIRREIAEMRLVLIIILVLLLIGAFPIWPYSAGWGYYPTGGFGLILVVLLIVMLVG